MIVCGRRPPSRWSWRSTFGRPPDRTSRSSAGRRGSRGPSRLARRSAIAAATRAGAVPPITSHDARAASIRGGRAAGRRRRPGSAARAAAAGSSGPARARVDRRVVERGPGRSPAASAAAHQAAHDVVGGPERDAPPDEGVGDGGGGDVALVGGRAHPDPIDAGSCRAGRPAPRARRRTSRRPRRAAPCPPGGRAGRPAAGP